MTVQAEIADLREDTRAEIEMEVTNKPRHGQVVAGDVADVTVREHDTGDELTTVEIETDDATWTFRVRQAPDDVWQSSIYIGRDVDGTAHGPSDLGQTYTVTGATTVEATA